MPILTTTAMLNLMDINEIERWREQTPDGEEIKMKLTTSTPMRSIARFKARFRNLFQFPARMWRIDDIEVAERGIWSTYIVTLSVPARVDEDPGPLRSLIKDARVVRETEEGRLRVFAGQIREPLGGKDRRTRHLQNKTSTGFE